MNRVGIVNMYGNTEQIKALEGAIQSLGFQTETIDGFAPVFNVIHESSIDNWIFSGSSHNVIDSPQVPLSLTHLRGKRFLFICYSMESILYQLGYKIHERLENKKEFFNLDVDRRIKLFKNVGNPFHVYRNHKWFFRDAPRDWYFSEPPYVAKYDGEIMIAKFRNSLLVQFHPEKNEEGRKLILNWLQSN